MVARILLAFAWTVSLSGAFNTPTPLPNQAQVFSRSSLTFGTPIYSSPLFQTRLQVEKNNFDEKKDVGYLPLLRRVMNRFDTLESAGLGDAKLSGIGQRIKDLHGPKTYLLLALLAGLKWKWCFRNPYFWFGVAFCVKWYRARYVFKIPVWDRQPNWNNIITSKEQEKDLKAFTCKKCGSTLFIAKTREFFFEGDTGIGGLGCFSCGAKGAENFVQDRDRIVEDVADIDDYFEYERPLDFVSAAERRKVLKETGGDEETANRLLLERSTDGSEDSSSQSEEAVANGDAPETSDAEDDASEGAGEEDPSTSSEVEASENIEVPSKEPEEIKAEVVESKSEDPSASEPKPKKKKSAKKKKKKKATKPVEEPPSDDCDALGMDDF